MSFSNLSNSKLFRYQQGSVTWILKQCSYDEKNDIWYSMVIKLLNADRTRGEGGEDGNLPSPEIYLNFEIKVAMPRHWEALRSSLAEVLMCQLSLDVIWHCLSKFWHVALIIKITSSHWQCITFSLAIFRKNYKV